MITPYNAIKDIVLTAIRVLAPLINNPEPFLIGSSYMYSSFGGSPPKESEFNESIIIFTIRICTDASNDPTATIGYNTLKISKEIKDYERQRSTGPSTPEIRVDVIS